VYGISSTELCICNEIFSFSGQSGIDTWTLRDVLISGTARYSRWLVDDIHLTMQGIRDLADRSHPSPGKTSGPAVLEGEDGTPEEIWCEESRSTHTSKAQWRIRLLLEQQVPRHEEESRGDRQCRAGGARTTFDQLQPEDLPGHLLPDEPRHEPRTSLRHLPHDGARIDAYHRTALRAHQGAKSPRAHSESVGIAKAQYPAD